MFKGLQFHGYILDWNATFYRNNHTFSESTLRVGTATIKFGKLRRDYFTSGGHFAGCKVDLEHKTMRTKYRGQE